MFSIYLCGYINGNKLDECLSWRKKIRNHYDNWKGKEKYPISWLDPMNGKNLESISSDGNKSDIPARAFMLRDYHGVKEANLLIVNLDTFQEKRPLLGTIYELAWAFQDHKPVIAIGTDKNYIEHPFIKETIVSLFPTVEELIKSKLVNYYFKGSVSATD